MGLILQGLGFGVQGLGFFWGGVGSTVQGLGFRVQGSGSRVQRSEVGVTDTLAHNTNPLNSHPQKQVIEEKHEAVAHKWRGQAPLLSGGVHSYLTQSIFTVVLQKSIPTQISQLYL